MTVAPAANPVPEIVTSVPPADGPESGVIPVTVGAAGPAFVCVRVIVYAPEKLEDSASHLSPVVGAVHPAALKSAPEAVKSATFVTPSKTPRVGPNIVKPPPVTLTR